MKGQSFFTAVCVLLLSACEPEVGSDAWCKKMADTPKGDWSMNDASEFAANCVLKNYE
jgi:hypothetical protein